MRDSVHPDIAAVMDELSLFTPDVSRFFRAIAYAFVAYLLLSVNTYELVGQGVIAFTIGLLGLGLRIVIVAQLAIAILMFMALVPSHIVGL